MEIKSSLEGNNLLKEKIISQVPFLATKMGAVEQNLIYAFMSNKNYSHLRSMASLNAGITPPDDNTINFFCENYIRSLMNSDFMGLMGLPNELKIVKTFCPECTLSELRFLEPFYFDNPWSESLINKKVLIIHPFEKSITDQYNKREFIFKNKSVLPYFELLTIRAEQTNGGGKENNLSFEDSLNLMKNKIDQLDFDISILGCGAYGLLLANYIKNKGKQAIHIGGGLQILFGIKGKRWDNHPEISKLFNDHWIRPSDDEKTINYNSVEGGTYW